MRNSCRFADSADCLPVHFIERMMDMEFHAWLISIIIPLMIAGVSVIYYLLGKDSDDHED